MHDVKLLHFLSIYTGLIFFFKLLQFMIANNYESKSYSKMINFYLIHYCVNLNDAELNISKRDIMVH